MEQKQYIVVIVSYFGTSIDTNEHTILAPTKIKVNVTGVNFVPLKSQ